MAKIFDFIERLSPASQEIVRAVVRQLCENEDINIPLEAAPGLQTVSEGIPLWEASLVSQSYSPASISLYSYYVRRFLQVQASPTPLSIQQYLSTQLLSGTSPTAAKNELKALKSFFSYLYSQGLWPADPTKTLKPPKLAKREVKAPKPQEIVKLFAVMDNPKIDAMLKLYMDTGIRFSELSHLEWDRVDLDSRCITVIGKGNKERTIPLSPVGCMVLESMKCISGNNNLVFPSQSVDGWDNRDANRSLERLCRKAGIRKYTCHQFRHFFATWTLQHGGDLKAVSEILGHADASITAKFYYHTNEHQIKRTHAVYSPFAFLPQPAGLNDKTKALTMKGAIDLYPSPARN